MPVVREDFLRVGAGQDGLPAPLELVLEQPAGRGIRLTEVQPLDDDLDSVFRYLVGRP